MRFREQAWLTSVRIRNNDGPEADAEVAAAPARRAGSSGDWLGLMQGAGRQRERGGARRKRSGIGRGVDSLGPSLHGERVEEAEGMVKSKGGRFCGFVTLHDAGAFKFQETGWLFPPKRDMLRHWHVH